MEPSVPRVRYSLQELWCVLQSLQNELDTVKADTAAFMQEHRYATLLLYHL